MLFLLGCSMVVVSGSGIASLFVDRKQEMKRVSAEGDPVPQVIVDRLEKGKILFLNDAGIRRTKSNEERKPFK